MSEKNKKKTAPKPPPPPPNKGRTLGGKRRNVKTAGSSGDL